MEEKTYTKESDTEVRISVTKHEIVSLASLYEQRKYAEETLRYETEQRDVRVSELQASLDGINRDIAEAEGAGVTAALEANAQEEIK